jgi:hypothetical protein
VTDRCSGRRRPPKTASGADAPAQRPPRERERYCEDAKFRGAVAHVEREVPHARVRREDEEKEERLKKECPHQRRHVPPLA